MTSEDHDEWPVLYPGVQETWYGPDPVTEQFDVASDCDTMLNAGVGSVASVWLLAQERLADAVAWPSARDPSVTAAKVPRGSVDAES